MRNLVLYSGLVLASAMNAAESEIEFTPPQPPTMADDGKLIYYPQKTVLQRIEVRVYPSTPKIVYPIGVTPPPIFMDSFESN